MYEIHTRSMGGKVMLWACVLRRTARYGYSAPSIVMENISNAPREDVCCVQPISLSSYSRLSLGEPLFMYDTSYHVVG
jgi:hypothetical protein